jgi:hypothetical protein
MEILLKMPNYTRNAYEHRRDAEIKETLSAYAKVPFVDRVNNRQNYPFLENKDGSISTHEMRAEVDENGNWYAFPNIINRGDGGLERLTDQKAMKAALNSKNYILYGKGSTAKRKAIDFSKYYKGVAWPKGYYGE